MVRFRVYKGLTVELMGLRLRSCAGFVGSYGILQGLNRVLTKSSTVYSVVRQGGYND